MLEHLSLRNVGPAPEMDLALAPRLNLLTGDNGLGKSFLFDAAWWAITRKWPAEVNPRLTSGLMARPGGTGPARIGYAVKSKTGSVAFESEFSRRDQAWKGKAGRPPIAGLVLYAQVDGSFSIWDPARNYWRSKDRADLPERIPAYVFSPAEVWNGIRDETRGWRCNGLVADWAGWQKENGAAFELLRGVIHDLSAPGEERMEPGPLTRISLDDVRDFPTIRMPGGEVVPIPHASAGIRRILALAYLLVWSWTEHKTACRLLGLETENQLIFLIDEVEGHLHPKWQRTILRSLLEVISRLNQTATVQLIGATHSPLVLASAEPLFDPARDKWFDLDLAGTPPRVHVTQRPFARLGDASNWLTSEAFDLRRAGSIEAESVLEEATAALRSSALDTSAALAIDAKLRAVLGESDPFWIRWRMVGEKQGWLS